MGVIVIRCPHSGEDVSTGIEMDEASFAKLPDILVRSYCSSCDLQHAWWPRESRLVEESALELPVTPLLHVIK
jgi:hypothetical protein